MKMEFPKFEGGDPRGWILQAEKYFRYYQTSKELKVEVASMYLEGDALDFFEWINSEQTLLYLGDLVRALHETYAYQNFTTQMNTYVVSNKREQCKNIGKNPPKKRNCT